jgi:hypothetical protein
MMSLLTELWNIWFHALQRFRAYGASKERRIHGRFLGSLTLPKIDYDLGHEAKARQPGKSHRNGIF